MKNIFPRLSRITLKDWLEYHPYDREVSSDSYYVEFANDLQHETLHFDVNDNLVGSDYKYLSCMMTCYLEDIVSRTGLWTSFIDEHHKLYGKYLPFYDLEGYERGDFNLADIQFLIWHFCSNLSIQNHFIDPFSIENTELARVLFAALNEASDVAPANEDMRTALTLAPDADIEQIKSHLDFFFFGCYLHHYYTRTLLEEGILDIKNQKGILRQELDLLVAKRRARMLFNRVSPLLAQRSTEMLACWVGESHPLYTKLLSLTDPEKEGNDPFESHVGIVKRQEECFLEINEYQRIVFLETKHEAFEFIENVWERYHLKYGMDSTDRKMFDVQNLSSEVDDDLDNLVIFFNPRAGMEFYPDIAQCIAMVDNPFYDEDAETDIEDLILDDRVSSDFVFYLIDNQMIEIEPIAGRGGFHYVWAHCDFLLRYWKKEKYVSKPKL